MRIITRQLRTLLLSAAALSAVCLLGCGGGDNPSGGGGNDNVGGSDNGGGGGVDNPGGGDVSYEFVEIGGLKWMKENLNVATAAGSWCYGGNNSNCNAYGRLYTWASAKSACQSVGWRLPDTADWGRLKEAAGGWEIAGAELKSSGGWRDNEGGACCMAVPPEFDGTDYFEFSALPGGYRAPDGGFTGIGERGSWWTSTRLEGECPFGDCAFEELAYYDRNEIVEIPAAAALGLSVRCVKED